MKKFKERRTEPRALVDQYYSVEFTTKTLAFSYKFKIWNLSKKGICILVKKDSELLDHMKVGDVFTMKYYKATPGQGEQFKTKIRHISEDEQERFSDHILVGLSIL